jgi:hypothetical protein
MPQGPGRAPAASAHTWDDLVEERRAGMRAAINMLAEGAVHPGFINGSTSPTSAMATRWWARRRRRKDPPAAVRATRKSPTTSGHFRSRRDAAPEVAAAVALGGDCLGDVADVRAQPAVFGDVASDVDNPVAAIRQVRGQARAAVRARRRPLAGTAGKRRGGQVIVDIDASLVTAHSDKEGAEPTHKRLLDDCR